MIDVKQHEQNTYLAEFARFEKELADADRPAVYRTRQAAVARFAELGFPTARDEEWRFTSVAPLVKVPFRLAGREANRLALPAEVAFDAYRITFVNGHYAPELSALAGLPEGLTVGSLAGAIATQSERVEPYLARYADYRTHAFTALNTAFLRDGAFVSVARGKVIEKPIHLLYLSTGRGEPAVSHPRNLIVCSANSQARLVETFLGLGEGVYFTNAVTEVVTGENAVVDHYKLQREGRQAFHVATLQVQQEHGSNFSSHFISLGGALVRHEANAVLGAEGCTCTLNGLYLAAGQQHVDNHTVIDHAKPHCTSHELYKGILDGRARGVFNGKIFVRQDAQKTDAKQTNKTLLLSEDATINTKPQLEIYADDVKCTHGATVGQLDAESIFYLRSRGIGLEAARSLLTYAFANDIIGRIQVGPIRAQLAEALLTSQHLPGDPTVEEAV